MEGRIFERIIYAEMLEWKQQNDGRSALSEKFSSRVDKRLLVYAKDLRKDGQTILLPVYMLGLV